MCKVYIYPTGTVANIRGGVRRSNTGDNCNQGVANTGNAQFDGFDGNNFERTSSAKTSKTSVTTSIGMASSKTSTASTVSVRAATSKMSAPR